MRELMIHVERAVRPLRAEPRWKRRMREELWAHIDALYREELGATGDEGAALARARARFGDPAVVAAELQRSVPVLERWLHSPLPLTRAIDRLLGKLRRREGERPSRHALRVALLLSGLSLLLVVPFFVQAVGRPGETWPVPTLCGAAIVIKDFLFFLFCYALCRAAVGAARGPGVLRAIGCGLGGVLVQVASIPASHRLMQGETSGFGDLLNGGKLTAPALLAAGFLTALAASVRIGNRHQARDRAWAELELGT